MTKKKTFLSPISLNDGVGEVWNEEKRKRQGWVG